MSAAKKTTAKSANAKAAAKKTATKTAAVKAPAKKVAARKSVAKAAAEHHEVAALAHKYWSARGHHHGDHVADWLRAERELNG